MQNIELAVSVMTYPSREKYVREYMLPKLPEDTFVSVDRLHKGVWWNGKRCHNAYRNNHTHQLVLQDDLKLCKNFIESVLAVIRANPNSLISLYTPYANAVPMLEKNKHWITRNAITGQAMLMPVEMEKEWQLWQLRHIPDQDNAKGDDFRISWWLDQTGNKAWYIIPSLVQHIGNMRSTLGYNNPLKYSKVFLGEEVSGENIDWTKGMDNPAKMTYKYSRQELMNYGIQT